MLAALKSCSLIRFKILSPYPFLWGFPWGPSSSGMVFSWSSKPLSSSSFIGKLLSVILVPIEVFRSVPMMMLVLLTGI